MDSLEDDEAADAEFLATVRHPKATAKIVLANDDRVEAMFSALRDAGGLAFESVVAEPLGARSGNRAKTSRVALPLRARSECRSTGRLALQAPAAKMLS